MILHSIIETIPIDFKGSLFAHRIIKSLNGTNGIHISMPIKNSIIILLFFFQINNNLLRI